MKCPTCENVDLSITERKNVEIDFCPKCRGVWLEKGELDKIIELSLPQTPKMPDQYRGYDSEYYKKRKKESILGELFDF